MALWGAAAAAVVVIVVLLFYFFRANDPAARGPVPYKKFDYGAHMEDQKNRPDRQPTSSR